MNARREAFQLAVLAALGALLLAWAVHVTGADVLLETVRSSPETQTDPALVDRSTTSTAPPTAMDVEGGPDEARPE